MSSNDSIAVSIIVPVYNAAYHLRQALDSLRAQTLKNIEFICVNDGSQDGSGAILDEYAQKDSRFRIYHRSNCGVSETRNFGMAQAKGEYIAFMDADDFVEPNLAEIVYAICVKENLDLCFYDFQMFDAATGENLPHWWTLKNQAKGLVFNKVISPRNLRHWLIHGTVWSIFVRRQFLERLGIQFQEMPPCEDAFFVYCLLFAAKRIYFFPEVFYHYRRGEQTSAVSIHGNLFPSQKRFLSELANLYARSNILRNWQRIRAFLGRISYDIFYSAENNPETARWIINGGLKQIPLRAFSKWWIGKVQHKRFKSLMLRSQTTFKHPKIIRKITKSIEKARFWHEKDLYIITGQLNSRTNEPIDSWTFFQYLQRRGVASRYVIWREHYFLPEIKRQGLMKDVIVLKGDGVHDYEFVRKCRKELIRAKAVIQENGAIHPFIQRWLHDLPDCAYIFLQHGITYLWQNELISQWIANSFNGINVPSKREQAFYSKGFSRLTHEANVKFLLGGLPRWNLLKDRSHEESKKILFIMLTWRSSFNDGIERLRNSDYYRGLKSLLSHENVARLKNLGLRIVLAPHHHLANRVNGLDFNLPEAVEIVSTQKISDWIARSSICLTDFSSVSGDFLFLEKPVIYWIPDRDDPLLDPNEPDDGGKVRSACENLENWFNVAFSEQEVLDLIQHYVQTDFVLEEEKRAKAATLFDHKTDICGHLYEELERC